jgi:hypothetical protein
MTHYFCNLRKPWWRSVAFLLACMIFAGYPVCAGAGDAETTEYHQAISASMKYIVNLDGSVDITTTTVRKLIKALPPESKTYAEPAWKKNWSEYTEAYVVKPDGQRIELPTTSIPPGTRSPDIGVKGIDLAKVEVGDMIHMTIAQKGYQGDLPGKLVVTFPRPANDHAFGDLEITVEAPADRKLQFDTENLKGGPVEHTAQRNRWKWTGSLPAETPLPKNLPWLDFAPRFAMSEYTDMREFAQTVLKLLEPTDYSRAAIKKVALDIVSTLPPQATREDKAKALYQWVHDNIAYGSAPTPLGRTGASPEKTLKTKRGVCRDVVVLLEALLASIDIASEPVYLNIDSSYWQPQVPAFIGDHLILYLPDFDVYLDTTSGVDYGELLPYVSDKKLLHLRQGVVKHAPYYGAKMNLTHNEITMTLQVEDEKIVGRSRTQIDGVDRLAQRLRVEDIQKEGSSNDKVKRGLNRSQWVGSGQFKLTHTAPDVVSADFEMRPQAPKNLVKDMHWPFPEGFAYLTMAIATEPIFVKTIPPQQALWYCTPRTIESVSELTIPPPLAVEKLPPDKEIANAVAQYRVRYSRIDEHKAVARRTFVFDAGKHVCDSRDAALWREVTQVITADLHDELFLKSIR